MREHCSLLKATSPRERGSALITSMICIMTLEITGAAILTTSLTGMRLAERVRRSTVAFNLAESGAERAGRWLKDQPSPPSGTSGTDPFGGAQTLGGGSYSALVTPDAGNSGAVLKKYIITATGMALGRSQQVKLILEETSFGAYAYFTDKEVSSVTGGQIWFFNRDHITGPAHSNNSNGGTFSINWTNTSSSNPIFSGMVTSAASSLTYAPSDPASESDYLQIFRTGSRGFHLGVDPVPLPNSSSTQQVAAWGSSSGFPSSTGVYVPNAGGLATGGIYIYGDSSIHLQLDASNNQQFVVTQGSTTTTITVDRVNNQISRKVGSAAATVYTGVGNGVLYSTGHITSLDGLVADNRLDANTQPSILSRSSYTIATDVANGKNITIPNSITYHSAPDPTQPATATVNLTPGTLGLYARNVIVGSSAPTSLEIDAQIIAGRNSTTYPSDTDGSFYVNNWDSKAIGTPSNTLKLVGGLIQRGRGPVGTFNSTTGAMVSGYAKNYNYDPRMADNPPPYFPTTGNYDRVSWQKLPG